METVSSAGPLKQPIQPNQSFIRGRITNVGTYESKGKRMHQAVVALPSRDEFSMPGAALVTSTYRLGEVGAEVKALVYLTGVPRKWVSKDGQENHTADMRCSVVE